MINQFLRSLRQRQTSFTDRLLAGSVILFTAIVIERCGHGFDFTDEGYYLNSIVNPWQYTYSTTQFGIVYHPLFRILNFDIVELRQLNVISTLALAVALVWLSIRRSRIVSPRNWIDDVSVSIAVASPSLLFLFYWLPTPSYNSLTLQGLLIVAIGFSAAGHPVLVSNDGAFRRFVPAVLVGLGGALVFLAKPPSAALLAAVATPVALVVFGRQFRYLGTAAVTSIMTILLMSLALDGHPLATLARYQQGIKAAEFLAPTTSLYGMLRFEGLNLGIKLQLLTISCVIAAVTTAVPATLGRSMASAAVLSLAAISCAVGIVSYAISPELLPILLPEASVTAVAVLGAPCIAIIAMAILCRDRKTFDTEALRVVALALFFILCPYVFAFGTGSNTAHHSSLSIVFWPVAAAITAAFFADKRTASIYVSVIALISAAVTVWLVGHSMHKPYRQNAPLYAQGEVVRIGPNRETRLKVDATMARNIRGLEKAAVAAGSLLHGAEILDMTGGHPGTIFALGGRAIGAPWMIGGYPRSHDFAAFSLNLVPCRMLARAWILTSPSDDRALSGNLLQRIGRSAHPVLDRKVSGPVLPAPQYLIAPPSDTDGATNRCERFREMSEGQ